MTHHEWNAALRRSGWTTVEVVRLAVLEYNGQISMSPRIRSGSF